MATSNTSVKDSYDLWVVQNSGSKKKEKIEYVTHCTKPDRKEIIKTTNILKQQPTPGIWEEPLSQDDAPHGVWFGITMRDSLLPTISPFGTERVLKPVASLQTDMDSCNLVLYLEAIRFRGSITNIRLVLLREDDKENVDWCEEQDLYKLNINKNPFLTIDMRDDLWKWRTLKNGPEGDQPATWVVLFIPGDVDVTDCEWDTVEEYMRENTAETPRRNRTRVCTNCNRPGHRNPECPETVCYKCGGPRHWMKNCPKTICYRCRGQGHWAANCPF